MSRRVLCKFFAQGACLKGESCEFSHDWKDPSNNICTFYQKGLCSYGSLCRYDHVRINHPQHSVPLTSASASASSNSHPHVNWTSSQVPRSAGASFDEEHNQAFSTHTNSSGLDQSPLSLGQPAWSQTYETGELLDENGLGSTYVRSADLPICSFAAAGSCPNGEMCPHIHGDLCSICGKHCLHPYRPNEREEHIKMCQKNNKHLEALKYSQEIECCICLDRVLSKPTAAERKFGLLSECDHPFCISCIRNWRSNSPASGMDVNTALRACPICRKLSYFVIPSVIWYATKEEKQEIVDGYKSKLKSIDCKYFDFGNSTCPFGTSCFYKHTCLPGRNRPNNRRRRYRPQTYRPIEVNIEEMVENFVERLFIEDELDDYAEHIDIEDPFLEDLDADDLDSLLAMRFLLSELDSDDCNFSSDNEI